MGHAPRWVRFDDCKLRLTSASKVREWLGQPNAFALPAIRAVCRGATPTCWEGCYAKRGRMGFRSCRLMYERNYRELLIAGSTRGMAQLLRQVLRRVRFDIFRIHVSGDFFSLAYARAWATVCGEYPDSRFWCYTRDTEVRLLRTLDRVRNLRVFLSCDRDNWRKMLRLSLMFPDFGLSYYSKGETPPHDVYSRAAVVPRNGTPGLVVFPDKKVRLQCVFEGTCPTERADKPWPKDEACVRCKRCWR